MRPSPLGELQLARPIANDLAASLQFCRSKFVRTYVLMRNLVRLVVRNLQKKWHLSVRASEPDIKRTAFFQLTQKELVLTALCSHTDLLLKLHGLTPQAPCCISTVGLQHRLSPDSVLPLSSFNDLQRLSQLEPP